jgi:hypothetical protein
METYILVKVHVCITPKDHTGPQEPISLPWRQNVPGGCTQQNNVPPDQLERGVKTNTEVFIQKANLYISTVLEPFRRVLYRQHPTPTQKLIPKRLYLSLLMCH